MIEKISSKISIRALSVTFLAFIAANCISYVLYLSAFRSTDIDYAAFGFPWKIYEFTEFGRWVLWKNLTADFLLVTFTSLAIALIGKKTGKVRVTS